MADQGPQGLVVWTLDERRYGLRVAAVERVLPAMAITPLPGAPPIVCGSVNLQGRIVAVVNMRRRLKLPERDPIPSDRLLLASTPRRRLAFFVDGVQGVVDYPAVGIVELADDLLLIDDLDHLLSLDDEQGLERALSRAHPASTTRVA